MHTLSKISLVAAAVIIGLSFGMPQYAVADSPHGTAATSGDASKHQTRQQKRHAKHHARHEKRHAKHDRVDHPVAAVKHDDRDMGGDRGRNGGGDRMKMGDTPAPAPTPTNDRPSRGSGSGSPDTPPTPAK